MIKLIISRLKRCVNVSPKPPIQTFTYYIPAPPDRKTGYREKQFDNIVSHLLGLGFNIISVHTQSVCGPTQAGMWVLFTLQATNQQAYLALKDTPSAEEPLTEDTPPIEGLYYIEN